MKNLLNLQKQRLLAFLLVLAMVIVMAPLEAQPVSAQVQLPAILTGTVTPGYNVNVRSGPGGGHAVIGRVYGGQTVAFAGRNYDNKWLQLAAEGVPQWVNAAYIMLGGDINALPVTADAGATNPLCHAVIGNAGMINVRTGPGIAFASVDRLVLGQHVVIVARSANSEWVRLAGETSLWFGSGFVASSTCIIGSLPVSDAPPPSQVGLTTNIDKAYVLNARRGPGPDFEIVRKFTLGDQITLVARNADGSWVKIMSEPAVSMWINSYYTTASGSGAVLGLPIVAYTTNPYPPSGGSGSSGSSGSSSTRTHTVQQGETVYSIATAYGSSVAAISSANGINPNVVYAGQVLVIP
ncbi:SH3 domain-containing protein [Chloroflexota bacterium]